MFYFKKAKEIRKQKNIKRTVMAEQMGVSYMTLYRWETGERMPADNSIRIYAGMLGISVVEISDLKETVNVTVCKETEHIFQNREIDYDKSMYELDQLIDEFGDVPAVNINAIKHLKQSCLRFQKTINKLEIQVSRYRQILNQSSTITYIKDSSFKYRYVNDAFVLMSNMLNTENIIGYKASDIFGMNDVRGIIQFEQTVFKRCRPLINEEIVIPCSHGREKGLLSINPVIDKDGKVIELVCSIQNITEVSNLIDKLRVLENAIDVSNDVIFIWRENDFISYKFISKSIESLTGYKREEFYKDNSLFDSITVSDDFKHEPKDHWKMLKKSRKVKYQIMKKDNSIVWIESDFYIVTEKTLGKDYKFAILRDITAQMKQVSKVDLETM
ncbi:MAG: PAS domain S-box protein [bacterium]|nr:PAS domain S-box protein [bacterium]